MNGPLLLLLILTTVALDAFHHRYAGHSRYKRQFDASHTPQIDLNITVPYIFSARLYPYGSVRGDKLLVGNLQSLKLSSSFNFLGQKYDTIYVRRDGAIAFSNKRLRPSRLPIAEPIIAVYWMPSQGGKVHYRETNEQSILNLAQNEVNIQYRYGASFRPISVVIVTWENTHDLTDKSAEGNLFQVAIMYSESGTFAHIVYSKLSSNNDAVAGFSGHDGHYSLPESGTHNAIQLSEKSDIGIPGEFLFRIDSDRVFLCGAGFKGLECIDACDPTEWGLDCARQCHCEGGSQCNAETGICPNGRCNPGWTGEPICEDDVNECAERKDLCPPEQPDCLNTPGAFLCLCFEYDNITNTCKGSPPLPPTDTEPIPVKVVPLQPVLASTTQGTGPPSTTALSTSSAPVNVGQTTTPQRSQTSPTSTNLTEVDLSQTVRFNPVTIRPVLGTTSPPCRCGLNAECISGVCQCKQGWTGDGQLCTDINECFGEPSICGPHSICENSAGSYTCQCDIGYIFDDDGKCIDMDECAEGVVVCGDGKNSSICVNTDGAYECRCAPGYIGHPDSQHGCVDIDECQLSDFYCGEKGVCKNVIGSYECDCAEGYQQDVQGGQCVDIDECKYDPCDKAALCTNLQGSFKCSCIDGFVGNGIECHETILYPVENPTLVLQSVPNSVGDLELETPFVLFGKSYKNVYVSSNGAVSFGSPLQILDKNPPRFPAFVPLYQQYDLDRGGNILVKLIEESDAADYALLTRSSLNIQNKFHQKDFKTRSLLIVSFDKLLQAETDQVNTFQVVISQGDNATFLTYLFEEVECDTAVSGLSSGTEFFELPFELLANRSNIGEKGKWMFRIDGISPVRCPAGTLEPPLCQRECAAGRWGFGCENLCHCRNDIPCDFATGFCSNAQCADGWAGLNCFEDVDECITETHRCSPKAKCINTIGSYKCQCNELFTGDGFTCRQMDACYRRLNEKCSSNAICDETGPEGPECVCNDGYHGDGLNCLRIEQPSERPTLSNDENTVTDGPIAIPGKAYPKNTAVTLKKRPVTPNAPVAKDYNDIEDEIYVAGRTLEENDGGSMWFIIVPIALCGIWAILIAVIVAICCRKKRRSSKLNFKESVGMTGWTSRNIRPLPSHFAQY